MSEHSEQCALFEWAAIEARQIPELAYLFAVPNGGFRHKATAAKLRAEGLKAGVPDIFWPIPRGDYHGLWIEMKYGKNKPTKHQARWIEFLRKQEYDVAICYSCDEAIQEILAYWELGRHWPHD